FDACFAEDASQAQVYTEAGAPLVDAVSQGYNAALIAYGQTGSGKTYSMLAGAEDIWALASRSDDAERDRVEDALDIIGRSPWRGAIPRAVEHIFAHAARLEQHGAVRLTCTYVEIYNEQVFDLLREGPESLSSDQRGGLDIHEDAFRGVHVPGATEVHVQSLEDVLAVLWAGAVRRAMDSTDMNEHSSRSHTIFQVILEQTLAASPSRRIRSKLSLVDLAGSEKWRSHQLSKFSAQRISEMTSINKSLSNLGNCIRALEKGKAHVPFRNSKLTRLLQDSLKGNAMTSFLVTLSPARASLEETMSSLHFAERCKGVLVDPRVGDELAVFPEENEDTKELAAENARLRARVRELEARLARAHTDPCAVLGSTVSAAAKRLSAWQANGSRESVTINKGSNQECEVYGDSSQDEHLAGVYEDWLLRTLAQPGTPAAALSLEQRLAMAEWAVLLQFRKLASVQVGPDHDLAKHIDAATTDVATRSGF
ncbi:Kinesin-like protein KIF3B, partial [Hondaea fermentalgiana]